MTAMGMMCRSTFHHVLRTSSRSYCSNVLSSTSSSNFSVEDLIEGDVDLFSSSEGSAILSWPSRTNGYCVELGCWKESTWQKSNWFSRREKRKEVFLRYRHARDLNTLKTGPSLTRTALEGCQQWCFKRRHPGEINFRACMTLIYLQAEF